MEARLILEDGSEFVGKSFGSERETIGEVVFHTSMTGYQGALFDPSYCGQIVTMTYPLIGNYGLARDDFAAMRPSLFGLVVREYEPVPSNWKAEHSLDELMRRCGIPGISEVDTRMLTRKIRREGTMKGMLTVSKEPLSALLSRLEAAALPTDHVSQVSIADVYTAPGTGERIVLIDLGSKQGILRELLQRNCDVVVVPHDTPEEDIRLFAPDAILLSNGPGDPKQIMQTVRTVRELLGQYPLMGVGLGHLVFALACGADTEKMKFGHRGGNFPVKDLKSGRCYITSQNHGYTVVETSLASTDLEVTHLNNNDGSIEGLRHKQLPAFSVQYSPEATLGPTDSKYLFDEFLALIEQHRNEQPEEPRQSVFARVAAAGKGDLQYAEK